MKPYLVKTPSLVKFIFRNWVWSFSKKEKAIYLTFDDGPTPEITEWTLDQLNKYNAKATFFCIGKNVLQHPEIFQKIIDNNHSIGNHTHNHLHGLKTTTADYLDNINKAESAFQKKPKLFRPPYGKLSFSQAKQIKGKGYKIVMWDVLSADFDTSISKEKCLKNVIKHTLNGSIVVFHDSVKASEKLKFVLPQLLEYYTSKGFLFKSIE
ncbi:polysaccharide deacetylase family protein [Lutibacter sp.]|uniref:polysaccharide deacetylase family protein n=1 Tax=Lutibacter sp. TaxID=1925666 RepID=UPI0035656C80